MIAEVDFYNFMTKKNYDILKDLYDFGAVSSKVGVCRYDSSDFRVLSSSDYFFCEVVERDGKYYKDDTEVSSYNVYYPPDVEMVWIEKKTQIVEVDDIYKLTPTIKLTINKALPFKQASLEHLTKTINELASKIDYISNKQFDFNAKCNVHVPSLGLLRITTVDYCNDMCTEQLQKRLAEGWRIIACCPQPDQRRPDYILGLMDFND